MTTIELITQDDLKNLKAELISEIRNLLKGNVSEGKIWLKSYEVRKLLHISPGTLQNLRINGLLPFTKVGSIAYYEITDIEKMMQKGGENVQLVRKIK